MADTGSVTLWAAAVVGEEPDAGLIAAAGGDDPADLVAAGVLRETRAGRFRFRDREVLKAAYSAAAPGWRAAAHARVAAELATRGASSVTQARHVERAAGVEPSEAVRLFAAAAAETGRDRLEEVAHWLTQAVRLLPFAAVDGAYARELRIRHALTLGFVGRLPETRELVQDLLRQSDPGTPERMRLAALAAQVDCMLGHCVEGHALARRELAAPEEGRASAGGGPAAPGPRAGGAVADSGPGLTLIVDMATCAMIADRAVDDRPRLDRALAISRQTGGPRAMSLAALRALADRAAGAVGETTHDLIAEVAAAVDGWTDDELFESPETALILGWAERRLHRPAAAERHLGRVLTLLRARLVSSYLDPYVAYDLAGAQTTLGRLSAAARTAARAVEAARRIGGPELEIMCVARQSVIAAWTGAPAQAHRLAGEAAERAFGRSGWMSPSAAAAAAEALLHSGDPQGAVDLLAEVDLARFDPYSRVGVLATLAQGLRLSGRDPAGPAGAALDLCAQQGTAAAWGPALLAAGVEPVRAAAWFAGIGDPVGEGRAWQAAGDLDRAAELFDRAGARMFADGLARLRPVSTLSERQRRIVELVAAGYSTRKIATELYVTVGTVEKSLTRIYSALGVSSRTAMLAALS